MKIESWEIGKKEDEQPKSTFKEQDEEIVRLSMISICRILIEHCIETGVTGSLAFMDDNKDEYNFKFNITKEA